MLSFICLLFFILHACLHRYLDKTWVLEGLTHYRKIQLFKAVMYHLVYGPGSELHLVVIWTGKSNMIRVFSMVLCNFQGT